MAAQPAAEACACAAAPGDDGEEMNGRKVALITGITGQVTVAASRVPGLSPGGRGGGAGLAGRPAAAAVTGAGGLGAGLPGALAGSGAFPPRGPSP